jgi:translation initiation factor IF-2
VIESELDRSKGVVATLLVQNGTLRVGDVVVAGVASGRIRAMFDYQGKPAEEATPSMPVSVMGLSDVPVSGELFTVVDTEREAKALAGQRRLEEQESHAKPRVVRSLEQIFEAIQAGEVHELRLVLKADVQGSLEPIVNSLKELSAGDIRVNILHGGTGNITENDVLLAAASEAIVIGFNVTPDQAARRVAESEGVDIRVYEVIYRLTEDVEKALKGMLEPETRRVVLGQAQVRAVFRIPKVGNIAGCIVTQGELRRNARVSVLRGQESVFEGNIASLKHEKEDEREIREGFECGVAIKGFDSFQEGDILECYTEEKVAAA